MFEQSIPTLVGIHEFAEILGWKKSRLSVKLSRQMKGHLGRYRLPTPIQMIAATPLWTREQALQYKIKIQK